MRNLVENIHCDYITLQPQNLINKPPRPVKLNPEKENANYTHVVPTSKPTNT